VIVHDFNLVRTVFTPDKANTPLVVDADAVLILALASERFELIARWNSQVGQHHRGVQLQQLAPRYPFDVPEPGYRPAAKKRFGIWAKEGMNHGVF
jgi:hypothetical protein